MDSILETFQSWIANASVERVVILIIGSVVVFALTSFLKKGVNRSVKDDNSRYRVRKAINFAGYLLVVLVLLFVYGDKLGNVGVALGVAGAGIAFALQEVIVSFAGWLSIMATGNPSVGQRVKIGEVKGDIIDVGIMSTTVMEIGDWVDGDLYNGRIITMANSYVFKENIRNYSAEYPFLWDEIQVPIRTESDHVLARKVFTDVVNDICKDYAERSEAKWKQLALKFRVESARVLPTVTLKFDQNWITFTVRYIVDYKLRRTTKDKIFTALLEEISKHDSITIATSTSEVTSIVKPSEEEDESLN